MAILLFIFVLALELTPKQQRKPEDKFDSFENIKKQQQNIDDQRIENFKKFGKELTNKEILDELGITIGFVDYDENGQLFFKDTS